MTNDLMSIFAGKKVLITGGTGSLGQALTERILNSDVEQIRILSRNEFKQISMETKLPDERLRFLIGDVRDKDRLIRALDDVDIVFHAAALKHVPKVEYNPFEAIKTNVQGSQNVIDACLENDVQRAICIGTDKAVSPLNTYGATKLLMEKLFITAKRYSNPKKHPTKFFAVRYGNVFGSSGSVIPKFIEQINNNKKITITDPTMTRFSITMNQALDFILKATQKGHGAEVFIPKLKAYSLQQIHDILSNLTNAKDHEIIGMRTGEKQHELLINSDEMRDAWSYDNMFVLLNDLHESKNLEEVYPGIKKIEDLDVYSSAKAQQLSTEEITENIKDLQLL
jgi:UDP-N-acetylglucosamine 4,6-dehydratase/UDP-glucose 4-epimerase|tara:strand:+ start:83 stop:1099 length:1017 start_codon:yes stop_codon:yes gene_type:complete